MSSSITRSLAWSTALCTAMMTVASPALAGSSGLGLAEVAAEDCADALLADPGSGALDCAVDTQNDAAAYAQRYLDGALGTATLTTGHAMVTEVGEQVLAFVASVVPQVPTLGDVDYGTTVNTAGLEVGVGVGVLGIEEEVVVSPDDVGVAATDDGIVSLSSGDSLYNMEYVTTAGANYPRARNDNKIDGMSRFNLYRSSVSTGGATFHGTSQWISLTPYNGANVRYLETAIRPETESLIVEASPRSVNNYGHAGSTTISAMVGAERGVSAQIGLSRTWNHAEGQTGGGVLADETHYTAWQGTSSTAKGTDGVTTWRVPNGVSSKYQTLVKAHYRP